MVLAEERRDVGRQRVDQSDQLLGAGAAQVLAILLIGLQSQLAQATAEPALDQLSLVWTEHDAGVLTHHVADEIEFGIADHRAVRARVGEGDLRHWPRRATKSQPRLPRR